MIELTPIEQVPPGSELLSLKYQASATREPNLFDDRDFATFAAIRHWGTQETEPLGPPLVQTILEFRTPHGHVMHAPVAAFHVKPYLTSTAHSPADRAELARTILGEVRSGPLDETYQVGAAVVFP